MLLMQRCNHARSFPDWERHRHHKGRWRVIICSSHPDTLEERVEIERDADRHLADVCRRTQREAMAVALGKIGWTAEHLHYAEVQHDFEVEQYGSCVFNDGCPVCAMSQP